MAKKSTRMLGPEIKAICDARNQRLRDEKERRIKRALRAEAKAQKELERAAKAQVRAARLAAKAAKQGQVAVSI